jgi:hypothetical protein
MQAQINWGSSKVVMTKNGQKTVRSSTMFGNHPAWTAWRNDKEKVKALHFSLGKQFNGTGWELTHWEGADNSFSFDVNELIKLIGQSAVDEEAAKEAQKIDWVAKDARPLTSDPSEKLFDWQKSSCQRVVSALINGNAMDASQTGAGKTWVALAACAELGLTPYVLAPLAVLEAWRRAANAIGVVLGDVCNYEKARGGSCKFISKEKSGYDFSPVIPNDQLFGNGDSAKNFKPILIFDEVQKCKSQTSLQGKMLQDCSKKGAKILCLSATAAKDPTEMLGLGLALGLHEGGDSYRKWCVDNGCYNGAKLIFTSNARRAADCMAKIHKSIFPKKGTRIRSSDVPNYPENRVSAHLVESDEIIEGYATLVGALDKIEEDLASGNMTVVDAKAMGLAEITKARRASEHGKIEWMIEETKEMVSEGFQVVVFLNFREHLAMMRDGLGMSIDPIWGTKWLGRELIVDNLTGKSKLTDINGSAQSPELRQSIIDQFMSGKNKVILVSLSAGGAGISLHDDRGIAPRQSLISPSYSAIDLVQAVGRIWRAGSKSKATQRIIYASKTIEEEIAASITAKINNIETLNDGDIKSNTLSKFTSI